EVGTGFHPDLTGRENVYLNGAVLGMKRAEIARKFDEIVAFSEIEKFIETPVKFYSSGMYVRLAFSVAAHLEPEILIMDEVLAVGDAAFQQKCLDKMHEIRRQGRTIFFVSHNMPAVTRLCKRAVLLEHVPVVEMHNEEGTRVFRTHDAGAEWSRRPRPRGRYTSAVELPGNFLSEGSLIAHVSIMSHFPSTILHAYAPNAVAFQVVDEPGEGSARGDYVGPMPGVVRPLLDWTTRAE